MEIPPRLCDGQGTCEAAKPPQACRDGGTCLGDACGTACTTDANCQTATHFCDNMICRQKRTQAQACTAPGQCASGFCVDGVCCASECTDLCRACNVTNSVGTCTPVPAGSDPRGVCAAMPTSSCQTDGECNGAGACRLYGPSTACGAGSCASSIATPAPACNGMGTCVPGAPRDCGGYVCSGVGCGTTCTTGAQCNAGYVCSGSTCQPLPGPVLRWRLDESSGGTALDASGNNFHGSYIGSIGTPTPSSMVPPVTSNNPLSRAFSKSAQHAVRLAPMPAVIRSDGNFTVSVWYRATSVDLGRGVGASDLVSGGDSFIVRLLGAGVEVTARTTSGGAGIHTVCAANVTGHLDGAWHHFAAVFASGEIRSYLDGTLRCSRGIAGILYDRGTDLFAGRHGNLHDEFDFDGNLDDVRIYSRVLAADEIIRLAQGRQ
jgi:hypothetical protein